MQASILVLSAHYLTPKHQDMHAVSNELLCFQYTLFLRVRSEVIQELLCGKGEQGEQASRSHCSSPFPMVYFKQHKAEGQPELPQKACKASSLRQRRTGVSGIEAKQEGPLLCQVLLSVFKPLFEVTVFMKVYQICQKVKEKKEMCG